MGAVGRTSAWQVKRARLCDGYRARTFGVYKGRRKAGLCLCVDVAADADVEHCRPWCDWIEALAELNLVALKQFHIHLNKRKKLSGGANREAMERESNDRPTVRPSASTVRVDRPCAAHDTVDDSTEKGYHDACSSDPPRPLLLSKSLVWPPHLWTILRI